MNIGAARVKEELAQWRETIRLDVVWAAPAARHIGWMAIDPGSVVRGIASVRVQGLDDTQARWLLLEFDDDLGGYVAEWRQTFEEGGA
jgi:hypothetical protein